MGWWRCHRSALRPRVSPITLAEAMANVSLVPARIINAPSSHTTAAKLAAPCGGVASNSTIVRYLTADLRKS